VTENIDDGTQYTYMIQLTRNRNKILRDLTGRWWFYFQRTQNICYTSMQHQEGKFQKRDVSRVTCLSKPITQQF
jgi:hypothetical protein